MCEWLTNYFFYLFAAPFTWTLVFGIYAMFVFTERASQLLPKGHLATQWMNCGPIVAPLYVKHPELRTLHCRLCSILQAGFWGQFIFLLLMIPVIAKHCGQ